MFSVEQSSSKKIINTLKTLVEAENIRQNNTISLIASENHCSDDVRSMLGSCLTDKYAEGYPGRRYYHGCVHVDEIERIVIDAACKLFNATWANVQPHSGSQANQAVFMSLLNPGDKILGMNLTHGGHLSHGSKANLSGKIYNGYYYGLDDNGIINMDDVRKCAIQVKPKLIIAGTSSYSRIIDWCAFRNIADEVGAYLLCDIAHYAGLIASGIYPNPLPYAHVVTSTTHKSLRGPRGGLIMLNKESYSDDLSKKIDISVFPGLQGGPMMHAIAAKGVCFAEAMTEEFKEYSKMVVLNARCMVETFIDLGWDIISNGTDCHMFVINLKSKINLTGQEAADLLQDNGIVVSKSCIPNDIRPPSQGSGIRIGTGSATSAGMSSEDAIKMAYKIDKILCSRS